MRTTRRSFLARAGQVVGLAATTVPAIAALAREMETAEDFWAFVQQSFTSGRGIINLNNGGVSPSPRIVTEALTRYIWEQEDTTAYTMWQILEPQSERIRTELAALFGCDRGDLDRLEHHAVAQLALAQRREHARIVLRRGEDLVSAVAGPARRGGSPATPRRCG